MQVEIGSVLEAKVTGITKFGAFVKFENDQTAMVHISEIATSYVNDIAEHLTQGQVVKVKVLNISEDGKISASIKRALPMPERPEGGPPRGPRPGGGPGGPRPGGGGRFGGGPGGPGGGGRPGGPGGSRPSGGRAPAPPRGSLASQFPGQPATFEDMLSKFIQTSDDKMSDMKKTMNQKHQGRRRSK